MVEGTITETGIRDLSSELKTAVEKVLDFDHLGQAEILSLKGIDTPPLPHLKGRSWVAGNSDLMVEKAKDGAIEIRIVTRVGGVETILECKLKGGERPSVCFEVSEDGNPTGKFDPDKSKEYLKDIRDFLTGLKSRQH